MCDVSELLRTRPTLLLSDKGADILACTNAPCQNRGGNELEASLLSEHRFHSGASGTVRADLESFAFYFY